MFCLLSSQHSLRNLSLLRFVGKQQQLEEEKCGSKGREERKCSCRPH